MIIQLNGKWTVRRADSPDEYSETALPASVYDILFKTGKIPDPYYGENQYAVFGESAADRIFENIFTADKELMSCEKIYLRFKGVDTLADVFSTAYPSAGRRICTVSINLMLRTKLRRAKMPFRCTFTPLSSTYAACRKRKVFGE